MCIMQSNALIAGSRARFTGRYSTRLEHKGMSVDDMETCWLCKGKYGEHDPTDCPLWEDAKALTIARLETLPSNIRISIG
jgi:hypothetical protein